MEGRPASAGRPSGVGPAGDDIGIGSGIAARARQGRRRTSLTRSLSRCQRTRIRFVGGTQQRHQPRHGRGHSRPEPETPRGLTYPRRTDGGTVCRASEGTSRSSCAPTCPPP
jgi:hypothetical protein